jgi:hypothetical protein
MTHPTPLAEKIAANVTLTQLRRVRTPSGCAACQHREPEWRDGGWCYMFRKVPTPTCAQFRPSTRDAALAAAAKGQGTVRT